jgi:hypothetical protein
MNLRGQYGVMKVNQHRGDQYQFRIPINSAGVRTHDMALVQARVSAGFSEPFF